MIRYFQQRRLLCYQSRDIRSRLHGLRSEFVDIHDRLWDWRQERSGFHPPFQGDWERDMTLSELVDDFGLNALRLVRLCDVWFQERELEDGRRKFAASVGPYHQDRMKLMDPWGISSETKPRSALLETIVTELMPYPEFVSLDTQIKSIREVNCKVVNVIHRQSVTLKRMVRTKDIFLLKQ